MADAYWTGYPSTDKLAAVKGDRIKFFAGFRLSDGKFRWRVDLVYGNTYKNLFAYTADYVDSISRELQFFFIMPSDDAYLFITIEYYDETNKVWAVELFEALQMIELLPTPTDDKPPPEDDKPIDVSHSLEFWIGETDYDRLVNTKTGDDIIIKGGIYNQKSGKTMNIQLVTYFDKPIIYKNTPTTKIVSPMISIEPDPEARTPFRFVLGEMPNTPQLHFETRILYEDNYDQYGISAFIQNPAYMPNKPYYIPNSPSSLPNNTSGSDGGKEISITLVLAILALIYVFTKK